MSAWGAGGESGEELVGRGSGISAFCRHLSPRRRRLRTPHACESGSRSHATLTLCSSHPTQAYPPPLCPRLHSRTRIVNREATTYARLGAGATPHLAVARQLLGALSGETEPEEMIAWAMIE